MRSSGSAIQPESVGGQIRRAAEMNMIEAESEENKESSFAMEFPEQHLDHLNSEVQVSNYESS